MQPAGRWLEVADGVLARRYAELDQTLGLVIGSRRCLVIDTGRDEAHGAEFAAAIREVTSLPWIVVVTHAHFDHFLGTHAFGDCPLWSHPRCRDAMVETVEEQRIEWAADYPGVTEARTVLPTHFVDEQVELDLGGRTVQLRHLGRGHTDHDVVVHIPDARVVFAGDLVEQGAPPSIGPDSSVDEWPSTLDRLLAWRPEVVVPGHGEPVDADHVREQRDAIAGST